MQDRIDAAMASAAVWFMDAWTIVERGWRRPLSKLALRLNFAFYPLLAVAGAIRDIEPTAQVTVIGTAVGL